MANTVMAKMAVQIAANTAEFNKALTKTSKDLSAFTGNISKVAGSLGVAFGASQVASFALEISKLAGEAEGVSNAFNKLNNSKQLMLDLKDATSGTVSELTLMKRAVQFSNFGLELSKLPTLLEFATKRAQATGQSVDYLVDSIVTGLGRKSVLILDNLGISAIQLREEMAKVGDITVAVSNIIDRDVANSGGIIETVAIRTERLSASWENFKVSVGKAANDTGILGNALEGLNTTLIVLSSNTLNAGEKIAFFAGDAAVKSAILFKHYSQEIVEANRQTARMSLVQKNASDAFKKYNGDIEEFKKNIAPGHANTELLIEAFKKLQKQQSEQKNIEGTLQALMEEQAVLQKQKLTLTGQQLAQTNIRLQQITEEIKLLNELGLATDKLDSLSRKRFEKPLAVRKLPSATGTLVDPNFLKIDTKALVANLQMLPQQMQPIFLEIQGLFSSMEEAALSVGNVMANAIEGAFSGALSGIQILRRATSEIVDLFARQAIAAAIANAAKAGSPFPFGAVIAATAAAAAMRGLLNRSGVKSSVGGGGGSGSFGGLSSNNVQSLNFSNGQRTPTIVLMATGAALKSVGDEQSRRDGRIRANARKLS